VYLSIKQYSLNPVYLQEIVNGAQQVPQY
jgi:hypothetical protein